jgi:hypothetical protein
MPPKKTRGRYPTKLTTYNRPVLAYLTQAQADALNRMVKATRVPKTVYLREAVDDLLKKHAKKGGTR